MGSLRWWVIALIAVATVINYIDRNALGLMWPAISRDIGATKEDYALLAMIFTIAYACGQSLFGKIFDVVGTRLGFALSIIVWSLSIAGHAAARTLGVFALLRVTLGISEAGNWPGAAKANALWFPQQERAFAQGIFNAGAAAGAIVSAPLIGVVLFPAFGWQATFIVIGALGVLWLLPWLWLYRSDPDAHPWLSERERAHIMGAGGDTAAPPANRYAPGFAQLLTHRQSWGLILGRFFLDPIWWLFVFWLPIYLNQTFGFDVQQIGMFAWVPYVGAMLGSLGGGWFSGALIARGRSVDSARKTAIALGCAIMLPALLLTMTAATPLYAVLLIAAILFGFQVAINNIQTLPSDWFGARAVGSLAGMSGTAAVLGTLVTTLMVPRLTAVSFAPVFALAALLVPLSFLSIWLIGGRIAPVADPNPANEEVRS